MLCSGDNGEADNCELCTLLTGVSSSKDSADAERITPSGDDANMGLGRDGVDNGRGLNITMGPSPVDADNDDDKDDVEVDEDGDASSDDIGDKSTTGSRPFVNDDDDDDVDVVENVNEDDDDEKRL